jgi:trigger factor
MEVLEFREGEALRFTATVDVRPEVELGEYRGFGLELKPPEVTGEQVERELEFIREAHAQLEDRGEEPLRANWFVHIGYRAVTAEGSLDSVAEQDRLLELGSPGLLPGMSDALEGARRGETREFSLTLPDDEGYGPAAGREVRVRATIKAVKEKVLPALDDGFARTAAGLDSLEELTAMVKNRLAAIARMKAIAGVRESILSRIVEEARVELPEAMVSRREASMKADLEEDLSRRGLDLDTYLKAANIEPSQFEADVRVGAEQGVKRDLVMDAVARAEGVVAADEEIEAEYARLEEQHRGPARTLREQIPPEAVGRALVRRKTIDLLLKANTIGLESAGELEAGS